MICTNATLDLLAYPHSSIPYVQMGLITALWTSKETTGEEAILVFTEKKV